MKDFVLIILSLLCINKGYAETEERNPNVKSILWEISGNGLTKKSYLLGTFHGIENDSIDYNYMDTLPQYKSIIESVDAVATETDLVCEMNEMGRFVADLKSNKHPQYALMPDSIRLRDIFRNQEEYHYVDSFIDKFKTQEYIFPFNHEALKPYYTISLISFYKEILDGLKYINARSKDFAVMDPEIEKQGKILGKRIFYMEDLSYNKEHDSLYMDTCSLARQGQLLYSYCKLLSDSTERTEELVKRYVIKLQDLYIKGDLDAALIEHKQFIKPIGSELTESLKEIFSTEYVLEGRSKKWIPVIESNVHQSSCLIAVGALHLPGKEGLINLLRQEGYTLTPVDIYSKTDSGGRESSEITKQKNQNLPDNAIPFIFDSHIHLKATLNDSVDVTLIYDTGADYLYLDEDYMRINNLHDAFGKKQKFRMGGAGSGSPTIIDGFIEPISIKLGQNNKQSKITPIIKLRDILGCHTDGLLGNMDFMSKPFYISFSKNYIQSLDSIPADMLEGYKKLPAEFRKNRIYINATLNIDKENTVNGLFLIDIGSGGSVSLTQDASSTLNISDKPRVFYHTQAGGIGGSSDAIYIRASNLILCDTLHNLVVDCSQNTQGALSKREHVGLLGTALLSLYDIIFDAQNQVIYFKRTSHHQKYSEGSTIQMSYFDRTDICDGWIVNGLYIDGIAEKAGIEIGDIILSINGRPVKEITWEEQRKLNLKGKTTFVVQKKDGSQKECVLNIDKEVI